ncbi:MAG TPA: electron-transfer flavoprotein:ubiquinone oxidoreductase [Gaiellales bacterium]
MSVSPSQFPPPFELSSVIAAPEAAEDERIDVGVAIVGGGPAGLAAAIRLGQLLADDPELTERLGEVPIALLDKGRTIGSHQLSGAVVNPAALRELLPDVSLEALTSYGEVRREAVHLLAGKGRSLHLPTPPPFHNKGNHVFSLSRLARVLAEQAEELGVMLLPETDAQRLLIDGGAVRGVVTGDKGRVRDGSPGPGFEPGAELHAAATVLADGVQGLLTSAAIQHFGLEGENPQVYALGVKEVWRVPRPLDRVIHTLGWPLRAGRKYHEFGGSWIYPMGPEHVSIGFVAGLDSTDANLSVHDLLQELKTHPLVRRILEGGERVSWGAKAIPEGGFWSLPSSISPPGALICGDAAGMVNVPKLKGVHYALRSGMLAAETIYEALKRPDADLAAPGALSLYDDQVRESEIWSDLQRVRNMRQAFQKGLVVGGAMAGAMDVTRGAFPPGRLFQKRDAEQVVFDGGRRFSPPDGVLTFDKLSSVFLSGNRTRDDQPDHIRIAHRVPRLVGQTWVSMCPAAVYELGDKPDADGLVELRVAPSNCVQCGAITAKGGRLTVPEGGSGPEYTLT